MSHARLQLPLQSDSPSHKKHQVFASSHASQVPTKGCTRTVLALITCQHIFLLTHDSIAAATTVPRMLPTLVCAFQTPMTRPRLPLPDQLATMDTTEGQPVDWNRPAMTCQWQAHFDCEGTCKQYICTVLGVHQLHGELKLLLPCSVEPSNVPAQLVSAPRHNVSEKQVSDCQENRCWWLMPTCWCWCKKSTWVFAETQRTHRDNGKIAEEVHIPKVGHTNERHEDATTKHACKAVKPVVFSMQCSFSHLSVSSSACDLMHGVC